ncbi:MAG: hypothetical protein PHV62_00040 [Sulfuricurvum sp.]|nr:hypothetical protein [Sulfuricurvum sp.]
MRHTALFVFFLILSLCGDELSFGTPPPNTQQTISTQTLQIHSSKSLEGAIESLKQVPAYHRQYVDIYRVGEYYATRYQNPAYPRILPWIIRDFKKAGFDSSFTLYPNTKNQSVKTASPNNATQSSSAQHLTPTVMTIPSPLSQQAQTRLIVDATKAYQQHDFTQATIYYEMMIASGMNERQILINLAYLYGREGSFTLLEKKIEGKRGINDYLYSYGIGALEAGRSDLYTSLSPYLAYDKSGKLSMLCGYFFEQENNIERSNAFYKMAYNANPSDPHILYAYARSVDISGEKKQAIYFYTQLTQLGSDFETLRTASKSRIQALRDSQ